MSQGKLIVIEGLDGSGKATQAGLLAERLTAAGTPASGPVSSPASIFFCTSSARCSACSSSTVTKQFRVLSTFFI